MQLSETQCGFLTQLMATDHFAFILNCTPPTVILLLGDLLIGTDLSNLHVILVKYPPKATTLLCGRGLTADVSRGQEYSSSLTRVYHCIRYGLEGIV